MSEGLEGQVILVTGSSRGIGAAVAVAASTRGATVAVHYHRGQSEAERTVDAIWAAGGRAEAFSADLADGDQAEQLVAEVVERFGRLDGLVNNAGLTLIRPFLEMTPAEWDAIIRTDLTASFRTCRAAIPVMLAQGRGTIVNVASRLAQLGIAETAAYSAAKAGVLGLTRSLAREYGARGIRINAVAPGVTITEMTTDLVDSEEGAQRLRDMALGRFGEAYEVAEAVVFLLSDRAALFVGQTLNPNAGGYMP
jgi:3-oxoacyl-[acyl-carrier protein] reductase